MAKVLDAMHPTDLHCPTFVMTPATMYIPLSMSSERVDIPIVHHLRRTLWRGAAWPPQKRAPTVSGVNFGPIQAAPKRRALLTATWSRVLDIVQCRLRDNAPRVYILRRLRSSEGVLRLEYAPLGGSRFTGSVRRGKSTAETAHYPLSLLRHAMQGSPSYVASPRIL